MKIPKLFQLLFVLLAIILLSVGFGGCADDNQQIRNAIEKFYKSGVIIYYESRNSGYVMSDYDTELMSLESIITYYGVDDAKEIKVKFSEININEDFADAHYYLEIIDENGETHGEVYTTNLEKDSDRWKLSHTSDFWADHY